MEIISYKRIEKMLDEHVYRIFGENFSYRPQQKEVIIDIIRAFFDGNCNLYLLDAPTGSGKSIIALIVSSFLSEMKMKGYILVSDLMLHTQYEKTLKAHNLDWGSIKGVDNYDCIINHEKFSLGECKIKNVSYEIAETKPCFSECGYLFNRKRAINSSVATLTYSYWLIQMNYVADKMKNAGRISPFAKRDFVFCDEAHKIADIVQNHFSPKLDERSIEKLEKVRQFLIKNNLSSPKTSTIRLRTVLKNMFKEENPERLYALLKEFELQLVDFKNASTSIKEHISKVYDKTEVPKEWKFYLSLSEWIKDMHCKYEDYNHIIAQTGVQYMIKSNSGEQLTFNCLDESYMMNQHFHSQGAFKVLMTATMGDPSIFLKTIGAENARYYRLDSHFNYDKSPIYFYPAKKMSLNHKEKTFPWLINKVAEILDNNKDKSGIIHSGSYDIANRVYNELSNEHKKRVLVYNGSGEKNEALDKFLNEKNLILMGPSILEGLDLNADKSRMQIFLKIPYPSLANKFVSAKLNYQPEWYNWSTACQVVQGMGRSIRKDDDWAISYVLDGCLSDLFRNSRQNFPDEFKNRIVLMKPDEIK